MAEMAKLKPKHFRWRIEGRVAGISLDRPERKNPLTFESYAELRDTFRALPYADDVDAVVFGPNGGNFSSGGDVHDIIGPLVGMDMKGLLAFTRMTGDLVKAMLACGKPIIAAVDGVCVGAGAIIAMASDIRIATPEAKTAFLFTRVGLAGCDMGACAILPRIIGQGRAAELLYTGRTMSAEEGERWGFFNRLVPAADARSGGDGLRPPHRRRPDLRPLHDQDPAQPGMDDGSRPGDRSRSAGAGHLHADRDFARAYEPSSPRRSRSSRATDGRPSFLAWPFFEPRHRALPPRSTPGAPANLPRRPRRYRRRLPRARQRARPRRLAAPTPPSTRPTAPRSTCAPSASPARRSPATTASPISPSPCRDSAPARSRSSAPPNSSSLAAEDARGPRDLRLRPDGAALRLRRRRDGHAAPRRRRLHRLDGEKTWISNGGIADLYIVFARTGEAPGARGLSAFLVPADTHGPRHRRTPRDHRPAPPRPPPLRRLRLPAAAMIGTPGDGFRIAMSVLDVFRSTVGAAALGFARRALDESLRACRPRALRRADGRAADGAGPPRRHGDRRRCRRAPRLPRRLDQGRRRRPRHPRGGDGQALRHRPRAGRDRRRRAAPWRRRRARRATSSRASTARSGRSASTRAPPTCRRW